MRALCLPRSPRPAGTKADSLLGIAQRPVLGQTGRKGDVRQRPLSVAHDIHFFSRASIMQYTSGMPC